MEATANFSFDRSYFETVYSEWRRYRSRWRRYAIPLTLAVLIAGAAFSWLLPEHRALGIALIVGGLFQGYDVATHRSHWIRDRLKNLPPDKYAKMAFHDDSLEVETPHSQGKLSFDAISDVVATPRGLFLVMNTGVSIFVPRAAVQPADAFPKLVKSLLASIQQRPSTPTAAQ